LSILRAGVYMLTGNAAGSFSTGAAHNTERAFLILTGPGTSAASSLYGQSPNSVLNVSGPGRGIDADPQSWDLYDTWYLSFPTTNVFQTDPYTLLLSQESGVSVSFLPALIGVRIGDAAAVI